MADKVEKQTAVRLDTEFIKAMRKNASSLGNRASTVVLDEERGVGFELTDESRELAVTLYMTVKAMCIMIDWILESQEEFEESVVSEPDPAPTQKELTETCLIPTETFFKIVECTRISTESQDTLEQKYGISLTLH